jgi:eukaryotic-like serine/threonine-protein kinase
MARSPGEPEPPEETHPIGRETAAFSLSSEGSKADNVYTIAPGTIIARKYRVERTIGRGGMGIVVEALHIDLDTRVAIKFLLPEFMSYSEAAERFMREARAVAKLQTHHVVRVLDVAALESGEPYMVMELLEGEDLACHSAEAGPLAIGECIDHIVQACEALAEAHTLGIVHRDLKPANLFLTRRPDGAPFIKLLDFGVSKMLTGDTGNVSLTQTTTILGSALYMSPEQMRSSKSVDHRTDIYAIGACLFEIIGGRPPYFADSFPELCAKIYTSPPEPLQDLRPEVPDGLVEVIEKSIAREPEDRYQSVAEFVHALAPYAAPSTRVAIAGILRLHANELDMPPSVSRAPTSRSSRSRISSGGSLVTDKGRRSLTDSAVVTESEPARRGRTLLYVAVGAVAVALGVGIALKLQIGWGGASGVDTTAVPASTSPASEPAAPPASAAAVAPGPSAGDPAGRAGGAATDADAGATTALAADAAAGDAGSAAAIDAGGAPGAGDEQAAGSAAPGVGTSARPRAGASGRSRSQGGDASPMPVAPAEPRSPTVVNSDLSQETCTAVMPDGTRKTVPCN